MDPIRRSQGTTASERYLAKLGDRSFLDLWSYPNTFINKIVNGRQSGKELCDLLVVCGDDVIIFSDKSVAWPSVRDTDIAWCRWYRHAVMKSAAQVRGAERWIKKHPDRVFLDQECKHRLPIELPPANQLRVHGIVVALGAGDACRRYFGGGSGSLIVKPDLRGWDHCNPKAANYQPFAIGDAEPDGPYVHVLDDVTLNILMSELDTASDFTSYLKKKTSFIRSGTLVSAAGEEELLASYMTRVNEAGEHDFIRPDGKTWQEDDRVSFGSGQYEYMKSNAQYLAKKEADKISYVWDELITRFTENLLKGTTVWLDDKTRPIRELEQGIRHMALEPRFHRRIKGRAIIDAVEKGQGHPRFARVFVPGPKDTNRETGYVFLTLAHPKEELAGGYDQYRRARRNMLYGYVLQTMRRNQYLKRVIGIATEPPGKPGGKKGSSEDLVYFEPLAWNEELEQEAQRFASTYDLMREERIVASNVGGKEFPDVEHIEFDVSTNGAAKAKLEAKNGNRRTRRAAAARARRKPRR